MKIGDLSQAHAPADPLGGPAVRALFLVFVASLVIALMQTLSSLHAERTYAQKKATAERQQAEASEPQPAPALNQSTALQVADADPNVAYTGTVLSSAPTNPYLNTVLLGVPAQTDSNAVPPAAPTSEKSLSEKPVVMPETVQAGMIPQPPVIPVASIPAASNPAASKWPGATNLDASADVAPAAAETAPPPPPIPLPPAAPPRVAAVAPPPAAPAAPAANRDQSDDSVDLNKASIKELNTLRGAGLIGRAIIRGRPYASTEDLVKKRVLNRSTYARIKDQIAVR